MDDETRGAVSRFAKPRHLALLNLVGNSDAFRNALRLIQWMSQCDANVLIDGGNPPSGCAAQRTIQPHELVRLPMPWSKMNCPASGSRRSQGCKEATASSPARSSQREAFYHLQQQDTEDR